MKKQGSIIGGLLLLIVLTCVGCENSKNMVPESTLEIEVSDDKLEELGVVSGIPEELSYGTWMVYWDLDQIEIEMEKLKSSIKELYYFGAYFTENNELFLPENIQEIKGGREETSYITVVNDQVKEDGTSLLKDTTLLKNLFENENHVEELIEMAQSGGYDGIEIDYEGLKQDFDLWTMFFEFIKELYERTQEEELLLRVLLEPAVPVEELEFPEGPTYIMMCYNLYGYGTKPGPKADEEFLVQMVEKMKLVSENRGYALATGGFDFGDEITAISTKDALSMLSQKGEGLYRDEESQALSYTYEDEDGGSHIVWFADGETLKNWYQILESMGETKISMWRIGSIFPK